MMSTPLIKEVLLGVFSVQELVTSDEFSTYNAQG